MRLDRPFDAVTPTVDGDVLLVLARGDAAFTPPEVHRLAGRHSVAGIRKALNRLTEQGVVTSERAGNAYLYRLNRGHILADAVLEIASARERLVDRIRKQLAGWALPCLFGALFGSAVKGGMQPDSDIDLLLVADDLDAPGWAEQVDAVRAATHAWTGNDARPLEMTTAEIEAWAGGAEEPVLDDIAEHGMVVAGPSDYLPAARRHARLADRLNA